MKNLICIFYVSPWSMVILLIVMYVVCNNRVYIFNLSSNKDQSSHVFSIISVPEIIEPVFTKTSQNARFLLSENERFGLVFVKTGSINSGTAKCRTGHFRYNFF